MINIVIPTMVLDFTNGFDPDLLITNYSKDSQIIKASSFTILQSFKQNI